LTILEEIKKENFIKEKRIIDIEESFWPYFYNLAGIKLEDEEKQKIKDL
jgi:hypothetical protein